MLIDLAESSVQPYLQGYATSLQATSIVAGFTVSAHQLLKIFSGPAAGILSDRVGKRRPFVAGVIVLTLAYIIGYLAQDIMWLLASRALVGAGMGLVSITMMSQVGSCVSVSRRGLGYSLFINVSAGSMILAPLIGGYLTDSYGFRPLFAASAIIAFCSLVFAFLLPSENIKIASVSGRNSLSDSFKAVTSSRNAVAIAFELFGIGLGWLSFLMYVVPVYGGQVLGFDGLQIGTLISIVGVSHLISSMVTGPLSDRLGKRRPFVFSGILFAGLSIFLTPFVKDFYGMAFVVAVFSFSVGMQCATSLALVADSVEPIHLGSALGVINGIEMMGMVFGPVLCALILSIAGPMYVHLVPAIGMVVPAIIFILISRKEN